MARTVLSKNDTGRKKQKTKRLNKDSRTHTPSQSSPPKNTLPQSPPPKSTAPISQSPESSQKQRTLSVKRPIIHSDKRLRRSPPKKRNNVVREIKYFQGNVMDLVPKAAFLRILKDRMKSVSGGEPFRMSRMAVDLFQESYETYLSTLFESSYWCSIHGKRVTLFPSDIELVKRVRRE